MPRSELRMPPDVRSVLRFLLGFFAAIAILPGPLRADEAKAPDAKTSGEEGWTSLYDGRDVRLGEALPGWTNPYTWGEFWAEDGEVHLRGERKFFLVTEKEYGDFIFEAEVRVPEGPANSGFMFRAHVEPNKVFGYQAEVDPSDRQWAGGLYDEGRRGWLVPLTGEPEKQAAFDRNAWNRYRIECIGDSIRITLNGVVTADTHDPVDQVGVIGLQHHGEKGQVYRFRNIRIRDLGRHEWRPLFDGKSFEGWHTQPGGHWRIEDGTIIGWNDASETHHGILMSDREYDDFTVRFRARPLAGNSGFYFRAEETDDAVAVSGFQAEIDAAKDVGGLYETSGRGWVVQPEASDVAKWFHPGEWNEMAVSAHGRRILVHVNGQKSAEVKDDPGRTSGRFGLQLHGGQDVRVEFKDLEILVPTTPAAAESKTAVE